MHPKNMKNEQNSPHAFSIHEQEKGAITNMVTIFSRNEEIRTGTCVPSFYGLLIFWVTRGAYGFSKGPTSPDRKKN
jgi:hypothetical protein